MPTVDYWFDTKKELAWKRRSSSILDPKVKGPVFFEYPAWWILPNIRLRKKDLEDAPTNIWVPGIDKRSRIGKVSDKIMPEYVIDLPDAFEKYLKMVPKKRKKKFKYIMRKNSDLKMVEDRFEDIAAAWEWYTRKVSKLNESEGERQRTKQEHALCWELFHSKNAHTLSFYLEDELVGVNVSIWVDGTVYDVAFMRRESEQLNRRAMGFYAILKNIELAAEKKMKVYNILNGDFGYKAEFATRMNPLKHYIRCTKEFAKAYKIPMEAICELVDEKEIAKQLAGEKKQKALGREKSLLAPIKA